MVELGTGTPIRLFIAENQALVRGAIKALLSMEKDFEIVGEAGNGDEAVKVALQTSPDVALLDIEMPGMDGMAVARELRRQLPSCRSLILTTFGRPGYLRRAMESGASGFLLKDLPPDELATAIRRTAKGQRVVDQGLAAEALAEGISPLTDRERQVLMATNRGADIDEIARTLFLSRGTVRNHLSSAIHKLDARDRAEAARIATEKGWL